MLVRVTMADRLSVALAFGLLCVTHAQVQEKIAIHGTSSRPVELSEAFP
jgi:hypothetical protein